ncbi:MAG: site-specific integrase [Gammaproteobacteria bacterium]|jgi:integrase
MATFQQLASGKWRAIVRMKGISKIASFPQKKQVRDWATKIESAISQSQSGLITSKATLGALIDKFNKDTVTKGRTRAQVLDSIKKALGHIPLNKLNQLHIQHWTDKRMKKIVASSMAGHLSYLSKVLDWGRNVKRLDVTGDMARNVRSGLSHAGHNTRSKRRDRIPTDKELKNLCDYWDNNAWQQIPMTDIVKFAVASCMRQNEITHILIQDVDVRNKTVIIHERKDPKNKEDNDQVVPLVGEAWTIVKPRLKNKGSRLFPYDSRSVSAAFTRSCKKLKIKDLHFHDMRHAGITDLFRQGLPIQLVAIVSGHKDWMSLKRYT